jgi:ATP synthase protein I
MKPSQDAGADPQDDQRKLTESVDKQAERMKRAAKDRLTLLAQTRFLGTIGILMVLPIVAGAYLGLWLDSLAPGYSVRWTTSLIFLGAVLGGVNVYLFIRE